MPDLLLELFSEEIPARMQRRAAEDLKRLVTNALVERGFLYEGARAFATPRRLALHVAGLPVKGQDVREERKGPRVGAPEGAVQGFLKSAGLASLDQARIESDPKKGEFYVAVIERPGQATPAVLAEILPGIVRDFPWPKSMRWGKASAEPGSLRWVRPLHSIVCTFGPETEETEVVPFAVEGIASGDVTFGHRFHAPDAIRVRRFDDYAPKLEAARVVLDADARRDRILHDARDLAFAQGLELVEDEGLLEEVAGLVEWPVALMGSFDEAFLDIPPEVIRATIRANQKCFVLRSSPLPVSRGEGLSPLVGAEASPQGEGEGPGETRPAPHPSPLPAGGERGTLSNRFILVANLDATDGGRAIVAGNERVVRARLSDAKFFWEMDRKVPLEGRLEKLNSIVFHEKLGTQGERVERIAALARELAPVVGADPALAERAARLAKADLVTEMVGEFPELQGLMGRYYATLQGEHPSVAAAIEEHYKPVGPSDRVPTDPVSVAVALADKIDTLVGFWAIDEKPTGSKDPYALRRAALGVIRIVRETSSPVVLTKLIAITTARIAVQAHFRWIEHRVEQAVLLQQLGVGESVLNEIRQEIGSETKKDRAQQLAAETQGRALEIFEDVINFFAERLKVQLRQEGAAHDHVNAAFAAGFRANLLMIVRRVEALGRFLETEDGRNLLAGYRRAANILRIEEKKDGRAYDAAPNLALIAEQGLIEEKMLVVALDKADTQASEAVAAEDFEGAMRALAELRPAVDAFFDKVTVNTDDPHLRENRLRLLNRLRHATRAVADFSRIEG